MTLQEILTLPSKSFDDIEAKKQRLNEALDTDGETKNQATAIAELIALLFRQEKRGEEVTAVLNRINDQNKNDVATEFLRLADSLLTTNELASQRLFIEHIKAGGEVTIEQCQKFRPTGDQLNLITTEPKRETTASMLVAGEYARSKEYLSSAETLFTAALTQSGYKSSKAIARLVETLLCKEPPDEEKITTTLDYINDGNKTKVATKFLKLAVSLLSENKPAAQRLFIEHIKAGGDVTEEQYNNFSLEENHVNLLTANISATTHITEISKLTLMRYAREQGLYQQAIDIIDADGDFDLELAALHFLRCEQIQSSEPKQEFEHVKNPEYTKHYEKAYDYVGKILDKNNGKASDSEILNEQLTFYSKHTKNLPKNSQITSFLYALKVRLTNEIKIEDCKEYQLQAKDISDILENNGFTLDQLLLLEDYIHSSLAPKGNSAQIKELTTNVDLLLLTEATYFTLFRSSRNEAQKNRYREKVISAIPTKGAVPLNSDQYEKLKPTIDESRETAIALAELPHSDATDKALFEFMEYRFMEIKKKNTHYGLDDRGKLRYITNTPEMHKDFLLVFLKPVMNALLRSQNPIPTLEGMATLIQSSLFYSLTKKSFYEFCFTEIMLVPESSLSSEKKELFITTLQNSIKWLQFRLLDEWGIKEINSPYKAMKYYRNFMHNKDPDSLTTTPNTVKSIMEHKFKDKDCIDQEALKFLNLHLNIPNKGVWKEACDLVLDKSPVLAYQLLLLTNNNTTPRIKRSKLRFGSRNRTRNSKYMKNAFSGKIAEKLGVTKEDLENRYEVANKLAESEKIELLKEMYELGIIPLPTIDNHRSFVIAHSKTIGTEVISAWLKRGATNCPTWNKEHKINTANRLLNDAFSNNNLTKWANAIAVLNPKEKQNSVSASSTTTTTTVTAQLLNKPQQTEQKQSIPKNTKEDPSPSPLYSTASSYSNQYLTYHPDQAPSAPPPSSCGSIAEDNDTGDAYLTITPTDIDIGYELNPSEEEDYSNDISSEADDEDNQYSVEDRRRAEPCLA